VSPLLEPGPGRFGEPRLHLNPHSRGLDAKPWGFDRGLYVHVEVDQMRQELNGRLHDAMAARCAQHREQAPVTPDLTRRQAHLELPVGPNAIRALGHQFAPVYEVVEEQSGLPHDDT